jgi:uronate dehydrogenase
MERVLITGAAGGIGTHLRRLMKPFYSALRLSDLKTPAGLSDDEEFIQADLTDLASVEKVCNGVDGIVHLGGHSVEGAWETILNANIIGCYNLFEAARRQGVKRIVFASSNHAVGFYPRATTIPTEVILRPDSRYGVSKAFGEALGAMYAYKHGLGVTCLRIGNVDTRPVDERRLAIWLKPEDLVRLIRIGLEKPNLVFEVMYGVSDNARSWYDNTHAQSLGYKPEGRAEDHVAEAMAAQSKLPPNPVAEFYQGGTYCSEEYDADFDTMKTRG